MNTAMKKALALVLSIVMVLGTMGVYAYGGPISETECICSTKCTEGEINEDCPVCGGENGDITACLGKEEEKAECICSTKCTEGEINEDCPVCGGENGDITACLGKEDEKAVCICSTKCTEGEINEDCPVCGGEDGDITSCLGVGAMVLNTPSTRVITPSKPSGEGTEANPYKIETKEQLYWFAELVNGTLNGVQQNTSAWAELTTNITVNTDVLDDDGNLNETKKDSFDAWTPIGSDTCPYTGTFNGKNHTISGLYFNDSSVNYVGLFGYVGKDGVIQNVGVKDSYISGDSYAGGVCGQNTGGIIENCYNTSEVSGNDYVGGVCGNNSSSGTITNCYNTGIVSGNIVGGVCGNISSYGTITNCYNTGSVSGERYAGGVCGQNFSYGTIKNCYFLETATGGIGGGSGTANKVEEKENTAFASGEVAWLLNDGQTEKPWGQSTNSTMLMPVLISNLPEGVKKYDIIVRIAVVIPENTTNYHYIVSGSKLLESAYPTGYVFFADEGYTNLINDISEKTYDSDTIIYAARPVTNIELNMDTISLYVNGTETITATVSPDTASKTLNWSSSDDTVATVDQNGTVKGISKGTATITAEAIDGSGVKASCTVTVRKKSSSSYVEYNLNFDTNGGEPMSTAVEQGNISIDLD